MFTAQYFRFGGLRCSPLNAALAESDRGYMTELTVEEFSLKEAITSLRVLQARIEKFTLSAFLFFLYLP